MSAKEAEAKIDALNVEVCTLRHKLSMAEQALQLARDQAHDIISDLSTAVRNLSERGGK